MSAKRLNAGLVNRLRLAGRFIVTSGVRSVAENRRVGGVANSAHLKGLAVDLLCSGSVDRFRIVSALIGAGFKRIGVSSDHVHVDCSLVLPQGVLWME